MSQAEALDPNPGGQTPEHCGRSYSTAPEGPSLLLSRVLVWKRHPLPTMVVVPPVSGEAWLKGYTCLLSQALLREDHPQYHCCSPEDKYSQSIKMFPNSLLSKE